MTLGRRTRRFALTVHLTASVGWVGAVVAYIVLDVAATTSADVDVARAAFVAMDLVGTRAIAPLALSALLTGLLLSLGTPWGLFRHYWTVISLLLTSLATLVLFVELQTISTMADLAASGDDPRELPGSLVHSVGGLIVLFVVMVLNIYKPSGLTPYGWRKQQEERRRHAQRGAGP